jgi:hypothetical protein
VLLSAFSFKKVWKIQINSLFLQKIKMLMRKSLLIFSIVFSLATALQAASPMVMSMEMGVAEQVEPERNITITVEGNVAYITGANGMTLEVVSLTGRQVATYKIDSPSQRIELNHPKGCYILKIGKVVRKVTIR